MTHCFEVHIAEEVGVNGAILRNNILHWCMKNRANNKHHHNDNWWTYNSVKAFKELFPYMGEKAITTALKKLEDHGLIEVGHFNKVSYDRTKWYSIPYDSLVIFDYPKKTNENTEKDEPIPDINTDSKLILHTLNEEAGRNFRETKKTISLINARLKEGFTVEDFRYVIRVKNNEWKNDEKMSKFLRPETLFGAKFEGYLNQEEKTPKKRGFNYEN